MRTSRKGLVSTMNAPLVGILDYGMGNIFSIQNAVKHLGGESIIVDVPEKLARCSHAILPGVGAFPDAMNRLVAKRLDHGVKEFIRSGRNLLGICLGMQLLCSSSTEVSTTKGLDIIKADVIRFPRTEGFTIPQIQWNQVEFPSSSRLMKDIEPGSFFYFLHSYYVAINKQSLQLGEVYFSDYCNLNYCSAFEFQNVFATQFHPEKSGKNGLMVLQNFLSLESSNESR